MVLHHTMYQLYSSGEASNTTGIVNWLITSLNLLENSTEEPSSGTHLGFCQSIEIKQA